MVHGTWHSAEVPSCLWAWPVWGWAAWCAGSTLMDGARVPWGEMSQKVGEHGDEGEDTSDPAWGRGARGRD